MTVERKLSILMENIIHHMEEVKMVEYLFRSFSIIENTPVDDNSINFLLANPYQFTIFQQLCSRM